MHIHKAAFAALALALLVSGCTKRPAAQAGSTVPGGAEQADTLPPVQEAPAISVQVPETVAALLVQDAVPEPFIVPVLDPLAFDGSILSMQVLEDGSVIEERRHVQELTIQFIGDTNLYDSVQAQNVTGTIGRGQRVAITALARKSFPLTTANSDDFWLQTPEGYLHVGSALRNPYADDQWTLLEQIQAQNQLWTVRKYDALVQLKEGAELRNFPGTEGTRVLATVTKDEAATAFSIDAMTEETETAELIAEYGELQTKHLHWLRVKKGLDEYWASEADAVLPQGVGLLATPAESLALQLEYGN